MRLYKFEFEFQALMCIDPRYSLLASFLRISFLPFDNSPPLPLCLCVCMCMLSSTRA